MSTHEYWRLAVLEAVQEAVPSWRQAVPEATCEMLTLTTLTAANYGELAALQFLFCVAELAH